MVKARRAKRPRVRRVRISSAAKQRGWSVKRDKIYQRGKLSSIAKFQRAERISKTLRSRKRPKLRVRRQRITVKRAKHVPKKFVGHIAFQVQCKLSVRHVRSGKVKRGVGWSHLIIRWSPKVYEAAREEASIAAFNTLEPNRGSRDAIQSLLENWEIVSRRYSVMEIRLGGRYYEF